MVISVVSVVWNAKDSIHKTIESVLSQTGSEIEYIVVDGQSTDGTIEVLKKYENRLARLIIEKDKGLYDAMNKALDVATGDFLIFMNSGDTFHSSQTIENAVELLNDNNSVFYGNVIQVNPETMNERIFGGKFSKYRFCFKNICHQSI
ncbi:MAG TPA: glycosyltransferase, partial [Paludibacter sp.]